MTRHNTADIRAHIHPHTVIECVKFLPTEKLAQPAQSLGIQIRIRH